MGMFDSIVGYIKCPYCGAINEIDEQIKFTNVPCLSSYIIGDRIDAQDGVYTNTPYRKLEFMCKVCDNTVEYAITIAESILTSIKTTTIPTQDERRRMMEYVDEAHKFKMKAMFPGLYRVKHLEMCDRKNCLTEEQFNNLKVDDETAQKILSAKAREAATRMEDNK